MGGEPVDPRTPRAWLRWAHMARHEPRTQCLRDPWAHRCWWTQTNLTRGRGCLHRAGHRREGVKVQVQQTGLLRERPRGLKLGSSSRGGRQLVTGSSIPRRAHRRHTRSQTRLPHTHRRLPLHNPGISSTHRDNTRHPPQTPATDPLGAMTHQPNIRPNSAVCPCPAS